MDSKLALDLILYCFIPLFLSLFVGIISIDFLKKKMAQTIRDDGPKAHLKKVGTPSMGGIIFIIPILFYSLITVKENYLVFVSVLSYALLGLYDDLEKRIGKKSNGLSVKVKFLIQFLVAAFVMCFSVFVQKDNVIGLTKDISFVVSPYVAFGFGVIFLVALTNSVNFTDGLDGLASYVTIPVLAMIYFVVTSNDNVVILVGIMSIIGFLFFNKNPAQIFMGDTGSMSLGAFIGILGIMYNIELLFLLLGLIYMLETISVILQVSFFKITKGKRIFRMAPLHHHFELGGMREKNVVLMFAIVSSVLSVISGFLYFYF